MPKFACPYCGYAYDEVHEFFERSGLDDEEVELQCEGCDKTFKAERVISVDYYATKMEEVEA